MGQGFGSVQLRRAFLFMGYCLGVALFLEGTSRALLSFDAIYYRVAGDDEASWRLRWARHHARTGLAIGYGFDVYHPTRGWALKPGLDGIRLGEWTVSSNSRGLRGRPEYAYAKPAGTVRVLVFGDSFTFGEGVNDDETYASVLERRLPGSEVLNFGVHGYGHDQMLLYLREEGIKYLADVVLLGFVSNDLERNIEPFRDYAKPLFQLAAGRLVLRNTPVPRPEQLLGAEAYRSKFIDLLTMLSQRPAAHSEATQERTRGLTVAILDDMAAAIRAMGAKPAFAYLPVEGEIDMPDSAMTSQERFFFSYCRQRGIQSIDLRPFFLRQLRQGIHFKKWVHWGPLEHRVAAEGIRACLLEKALIPRAD